jgi:hypothetical protein
MMIGATMAKIGLMAFATTLLLTGISYAADKITLACSGMSKSFLRDHYTPGFPVSISVVVDLDQATVTTMYGVFPITNGTENRILFAGEGDRGVAVRGSIDRISGTTGMSIHHTGVSIDDLLDLTCKPAKPLF